MQFFRLIRISYLRNFIRYDLRNRVLSLAAARRAVVRGGAKRAQDVVFRVPTRVLPVAM